MFVGSVLLGFVHLIEIGLEFAHCYHREFIFLPILHFCFVFLIMHFTFSQSRTGSKLGFSNIALSHLLVTQVTLWLLHFDRNYGSCGYSFHPMMTRTASPLNQSQEPASLAATITQTPVVKHMPQAVRSFASAITSSSSSSARTARLASFAGSTAGYPFNGILVPVIHHYQLLTITILASIWLANNHADSFLQSGDQRSRGGGLFSSGSDLLGYQFLKKKASIKGFFVGLLMTSGTIVVLVLKDQQLSLIAHTVLQVCLSL